MLNHRILPLRTTTGYSIVVDSIQLTAHSQGLASNQIRVFHWNSAAEAEQNPVYELFHPSVWLGVPQQAPLFAPEVRRYRVPSDLPHPLPQRFAGIFVSGPQVANVLDARKLWAEFKLTLTDPADKARTPLIGGLIVAGYPYMPSYLASHGEPSANHGYPREMRISWDEGVGEGFLDDDFSITRQLPAWQSSFHLLETGPIVAREIRLRLSDFVRSFHTMRSWDPTTKQYQEFWAIALPVIFPFTYEEGTSYRSSLPVGMIAATQSNRDRGDSYFAPAHSADAAAFDGADSALIRVHNSKAYPFTPQSALLPLKDRRRYPIAPADQSIEERFISNALLPGGQLFWLLAQRDENRRCVAGLRIRFTSKKLRDIIGIGEAVPLRLQVYELDPLPGMPAPRITPDLDRERFARLIADVQVDKDAGDLPVRFTRPVLSQYFYLVLTAADKGHVAVDSIELVQSAHISVVPRPSRTQRLRVLHFRLAGENLGQDYALLGERGFHIAVDRIVAGEVRERLFRAHCLEDLVRSGVARLVLNSRTRAVERQTTSVQSGSYMDTYTEARTNGWDRSETGDIATPARWQAANSRLRPDGEHGFTSMSNEEGRTHVRHIADVPSSFRNRLTSRFASSLGSSLDPNASLLWRAAPASNSVWAPWRVTASNTANEVKARVDVDGLWNISIPPYFARLLSEVEGRGTVNDMGAIQGALGAMTGDLFTVNGAGIGASSGLSAVVANFSWSNNISASGVANALHSHSIGTTGSISTSARQTGYSYSQSLSAHGSENTSHLEYTGGEHKQIIRREIAEGAPDRDRRITGAEVVWNGRVTDLIVGVIPLGIELAATNESGFRTTDEVIRFSFGRITPAVEFDVWIELTEEVVRDDD